MDLNKLLNILYKTCQQSHYMKIQNMIWELWVVLELLKDKLMIILKNFMKQRQKMIKYFLKKDKIYMNL